MKIPLILAFLTAAPVGAAIITVDSYTLLTGRGSSSYPDSSGVELTDGVSFSKAWGPSVSSISLSEVAGLVGWLNGDPSIRFDFNAVENIQEVTIWAADSDGTAGVAFPSQITLSTPDSSFSQTFSVADPAGDGSTQPIVLRGFSVDTDSMVVTATRSSSWTMLSEVQFVPEPSSALFALLSGFVFTVRRNRRA